MNVYVDEPGDNGELPTIQHTDVAPPFLDFREGYDVLHPPRAYADFDQLLGLDGPPCRWNWV